MGRYVLVHGAWMDRACWEAVVPMLTRQGHTVSAPDLPGHGEDATLLASLSLQGYAEHILAEIDAGPDPVTLVGHSMAGTVISLVAEQRPEKIGLLVYLAAYLARDGESLFSLATSDAASHLGPALLPDQERGVIGIRPQAIRDVFFADCAETDAVRFAARVRLEPLAPLGTPVHITDGNFGRVPRVYISTLHDHAVSPPLQQRMYTALPCREVRTIASGHAPFIAQPNALVAHLTALQA